MKTYIFADYTAQMNFFEIQAHDSSEAIRLLVEKHGKQPYRISNIIGSDGSNTLAAVLES